MRHLLLPLCILVILAASLPSQNAVFAQDVHFSQSFATPLQVNPAMTGVFDGKVRVSNSYRTQWTGLGKGYSTIQLSGDAPIAKGKMQGRFFGLGLMLYQDKGGDVGYRRTVVHGSLSYVTELDDEGSHFLSVGFQGGFTQQSVDISKSTWDTQWNGDRYDPSLPSLDPIQIQSFSVLDFSAGLLYYYVPDGKNTISAGASIAHVGSPNISFYREGTDPLARKMTFHASGDIAIRPDQDQMWIDPRVQVMMQGPQKEIFLGGYFKNKFQFRSHYTNYKKEAFFYLGGFYRVQDAFIASARIDYNTWGLGISYDFNSSNVARLGQTASAFEISISYVAGVKRGERARHFNKMPKFL